MSTLEILFLSVALAMDCFTVSIVSGVICRRWQGKVMLQMSLLFGLFQAMMPFLGWLGTSYFSRYIESVDHWIAFGLLAFLGGKMIKESFDEDDDEHPHFNPAHIRTQLMMAVATSIDALAVGISFACVGYKSVTDLAMPLASIGVVSFVASVIGNLLGVRFGKSITKRLKPELFGGIVLLIIGVKILLSHLLGL